MLINKASCGGKKFDFRAALVAPERNETEESLKASWSSQILRGIKRNQNT
jgi:hypothetical protein